MKHVIFDCDGTLVDTGSPQYHLFPGIPELLRDLAQDCLLYVWTARRRDSTIRILGELGVLSCFESFSTPDDHLPKPDPHGLSALVGRVPKECVCVIGDSPVDIAGARHFGVLAIGATWSTGARLDADFLVSHPSECSRLIRHHLKAE
jgi:phosphoglycolate phosphatase-like HAD superfamily hydrolase